MVAINGTCDSVCDSNYRRQGEMYEGMHLVSFPHWVTLDTHVRCTNSASR